MIEISANIDDLSPQIYDHLMERLFEGGRARRDADADHDEERPAGGDARRDRRGGAARRAGRDYFAETSTIGVRFHAVARLKLQREIHEVETRWGKVRVKVSGAARRRRRRRFRRNTTTAGASPPSTRWRCEIVMEEARDAARRRSHAFLEQMISERLHINEIFYSIQGESTYAGRPCVFVRLTGCNLRCQWCDTEYAFYEGRRMPIAEVAEIIRGYRCDLVEMTGGEPLLQEGVYPLMGCCSKRARR